MGSQRPESSKQPIEESLANYMVGEKEGLSHLKGEGSILYGWESELESYRRPLAERGPREGKSEKPWFSTKHGRTGPRLRFPITLRSLGWEPIVAQQTFGRPAMSLFSLNPSSSFIMEIDGERSSCTEIH